MPWLLAIQKEKETKKKQTKRLQKSSVPPWGENSRPLGRKNKKRRMDVVSSESLGDFLFLCEWRARNTHRLQNTAATSPSEKYLVLYFVNVVATVQLTILNVVIWFSLSMLREARGEGTEHGGSTGSCEGFSNLNVTRTRPAESRSTEAG